MSVLVEGDCLIASRKEVERSLLGGAQEFTSKAADTDGIRYALQDEHLIALSANASESLSSFARVLLEAGVQSLTNVNARSQRDCSLSQAVLRDRTWCQFHKHRHGFAYASIREDGNSQLVVPYGWSPASSWQLSMDLRRFSDGCRTYGTPVEDELSALAEDLSLQSLASSQHEELERLFSLAGSAYNGGFIDDSEIRLLAFLRPDLSLKWISANVVLPLQISAQQFEDRRALVDYDAEQRFGWTSLTQSMQLDSRTGTVELSHVVHLAGDESWGDLIRRTYREVTERGTFALIAIVRSEGVSLADLLLLRKHFRKWSPNTTDRALWLAASNMAWHHSERAEEAGDTKSQQQWERLARAGWPVMGETDDLVDDDDDTD